MVIPCNQAFWMSAVFFFFLSAKEAEISILFHAHAWRLSLWIPEWQHSANTHIHAIMQGDEHSFSNCSWCETYSTYTIFCRAPIKRNCIWRSASCHCNVVCKILLPSTSLETNAHVLVKAEFSDSSCCQQRIVRCLRVQSGLSWSNRVRSEWPVSPLQQDLRHKLPISNWVGSVLLINMSCKNQSGLAEFQSHTPHLGSLCLVKENK